jgi:hypothetical protein
MIHRYPITTSIAKANHHAFSADEDEDVSINVMHPLDSAIAQGATQPNSTAAANHTKVVIGRPSFSTFMKFPKLPIELRLAIWELACSGRRYVALDIRCAISSVSFL